MKIKVITFTNADSKEQELIIPAIKRPFERKTELESAMFNQDGFNVKLQKQV